MDTAIRWVGVVSLLAACIGHTAEPSSRGQIEEIVVTASRIERPDYSYSNPVFSIDGETIRAAGYIDMVDLLKQVPALVGSIDRNFTTAFDSSLNGSGGLTALNLRNLGADRTLVLVNGRRYVGSPFPGFSNVDIDTLPVNLIERVEVMTGGASALYGADGVSGVVNFVMKDRYEGLDALVQTGLAGKGDAKRTLASLTYGTDMADGRAHFSVAANYTSSNGLRSESRASSSSRGRLIFVPNANDPGDNPNVPDQVPLPDVRDAFLSAQGAVDTGVDFVYDFDGDDTPWDPGVPIAGTDFQQGGDGTPLSLRLGDLLPTEEQASLVALFDWDLTATSRLFSELSYGAGASSGAGQPSLDGYLYLYPDNPYLPPNIAAAAAGGPGLLVSREHFDLGVRAEDNERRTVRAVFGFKGDIGTHLNFVASYSYGRTSTESVSTNNRYNDRFFAAIDAVVDPATGGIVCRSELEPDFEPVNLAFQEWNIYDPLPGTWAGSYVPGDGDCVPTGIVGATAIPAEARDWIVTDSRSTASLAQHVVQAHVLGTSGNWQPLQAGPIGYAAGLEWRREALRGMPAREDRLGLTYGTTFLEPSSSNLDVAETFAEVDIPLLTGRRFAEVLALDAAARFSHYSTIDSALTWKVGLVWQPTGDLTLRGTLATATRAPSLQSLDFPGSRTFSFITDPCAISERGNGTAFREANCATLLTDLGADPGAFIDSNFITIGGIVTGNPDLVEEVADTLTFGFIYTPAYAAGLTVSVDWYDIELRDAIALTDPTEAAKLCVDLPTLDNVFCGLINRDTGTAAIDRFTQTANNVAAYTTSGVDFVVNYQWDPGRFGMRRDWGTVALQVSGNHLNELRITNLPTVPSKSEVGEVGKPEWQANLDLGWRRGGVELNWRVHYFSETFRFDADTRRNNPDVVASRHFKYDRKLTQDVYGSWQISSQFRIFAGVNNLTDQRPDLEISFYPVSAVGRYFFGGLDYKR